MRINSIHQKLHVSAEFGGLIVLKPAVYPEDFPKHLQSVQPRFEGEVPDELGWKLLHLSPDSGDYIRAKEPQGVSEMRPEDSKPKHGPHVYSCDLCKAEEADKPSRERPADESEGEALEAGEEEETAAPSEEPPQEQARQTPYNRPKRGGRGQRSN